MKTILNSRILTAAAALLLTATAAPSAFAQKKGGGGARPAFDKGSTSLQIGLGPGYAGYYDAFYRARTSPAIVAIVDHGIVGNVGPGTIGLGGILGWQTATSSYWKNDKVRWTNFVVGVRGTYHLTILKNKNNKFDPYAGVMAGVRIESVRDEYSDRNRINYDKSYVGPAFGGFVGAKYNFKPSFGAWAELGYDVTFFKIGLNFNF